MSAVDMTKNRSAVPGPTDHADPAADALLSLVRQVQQVRRTVDAVGRTVRNLDLDDQAPLPNPWPWLAIIAGWVAAAAVTVTAMIVFGLPGNEHVGWAGFLAGAAAIVNTALILKYRD